MIAMKDSVLKYDKPHESTSDKHLCHERSHGNLMERETFIGLRMDHGTEILTFALLVL
jgi:hypothetical protein